MFKKIFTTLAIFALLFTGSSPVFASLSEYWAERGETFIPCNQERYDLAAQFAVYDYDCSEEKNNLLEKRLRFDETRLGASVATGYKTTLDVSMTSSQTTLSPSTLVLSDGVTLTMDLLDGEIFLVVEPGSARQEIIRCTAISSGDFSSCTRGLSFSGTSLVSVPANQYAHRAGSSVIQSNVHYVYENFVDKDSNETVSGTKRFASNEFIIGDGTVSGNKKLYFCDTSSTSTCGYISATPSSTDPGLLDFYLSPDGTNQFALNASGTIVTASSTKALGITNGKIHLNASSTGGLEFDDTTGYLQIKTPIVGGIKTDSNGTAIDTTDALTWTGSQTFATSTIFYGAGEVTSTPGAYNIPQAGSTGKLDSGWITGPNVVEVIAGESISGATLPVPVYQNTNDAQYYQADGNDRTKLGFKGFAITDGTDNNTMSVQHAGNVTGFSGLTSGDAYYLSDTVGTIQNTTGTYAVLVGYAVNTTTIRISYELPNKAGSTEQATNDSVETTTATSYTKIKTLTSMVSGSWSTTFTLRCIDDGGGGCTSTGRIYVNGVAVGTVQTQNNNIATAKAEDIVNISRGDTLEVWAFTSSGDRGEVSLFKLKNEGFVTAM